MPLSEIAAIAKIDRALSAIKDKGTRDRVLNWAISKYMTSDEGARQTHGQPNVQSPATPVVHVGKKEIPGIARLNDSGALKLTVRDPKATSANDAAIRLAHIAIHSYNELAGDPSVSSKRVIVPILREWRAYDGNTRLALARHKGIIREGDSLSLDAHSKKDALKYMAEALDDSVQGKWSPRTTGRKRPLKQASD